LLHKSRWIKGLAGKALPAARPLQQAVSMKNLMETLIALQNLELQTGRRSPEAAPRIEGLRKKVPESLLTKFDRWIVRGRNAVAVAHHGVCGECHLKLPIGVVGALAFGEEIQHCGNCGRFLYLPENEPVYSPVSPPKSKPAKRNKEAPAHVS
jgi:predicted  nucleic acid-binding Zn-ribbon protein